MNVPAAACRIGQVMTRTLTFLVLGISAIACRAEWKPLFNGKDLEGWSGDPRLWRVEGGVLVGETNDSDKKPAANTFLIWQGGEPGDFTLEYKARVTGNNNSGVQYRSKVLDAAKWSVGGYQMDLHPKAEYLGMLYEEKGRGIACLRGQKVTLDANPQVSGKLDVPAVDLAQWNTYRIVAKGNVVQHFVNDQLAAEITDVDPQKRADKGVIALQVHAGPPMKVEFKDLRIDAAPAADPQADASRKKKREAVAAPQDGGVITDMTGNYQVAPDFKLERIYQIPREQGSWVGLTVDDKGNLWCADQYGKIHRVTVPAKPGQAVVTTPSDIPIQGAHGLLWLDGVLWVCVCEGRDQSGVWRVTDTNGDGLPDKPELIKAVKGRGEHGPHSLVAAPDGKSIYFIAGNHTDLAEMDSLLVPRVWQEDQLLPRRPDARGHAKDRMAPGGWIARFTPDGKNWQLFSIGYRNQFDAAFNAQGDLFTYDADMEWDLGMPWYRPTRFCHVVPGSEFGWRNGTGKWPDYYEDSMPTQLDIGPGSPTGMVSGKGAKFPAKYQQALFGLDWTFATIYALHLTPDGAGYKAEREEFVSGSGLPLTDAVIGADGAMYFLTGGRKTNSALWRVTYVGKESTAPVSYGTKDLALMEPAKAPAALGSKDRIARFQARTTLENAGPEILRGMIKSDSANPWQVLGSAIGLARTGTAADAPVILAALDRLDWAKLDLHQQLNWLRAVGLVFARHGYPDAAARDKVLAKTNALFPASDAMLNRELCRMLSYLQAPGIVARTLTLMDSAGPSPAPDWLALAKRNAGYGKTVENMIANLPPDQVIHYVYCLRVVKGPWHGDERKRFFTWITKLTGNSGGASYDGFIKDLRNETLTNATPEEVELINTFDTAAPPNPFANLPAMKGPGRQWTVEEVVKLAEEGLEGRDRENGKKVFQGALCAACHRYGNEGGAAGPDLTTLGGRFGVREIVEAIQDPNKVVSDQYAFDLITRKDGTVITGKITGDIGGKRVIATNPFDFTQTITIDRNDIREVKPSPASPMPPGLINRLNPDELKDLLAFLLKGM
jgi:putative heme-binding domain-containing protein